VWARPRGTRGMSDAIETGVFVHGSVGLGVAEGGCDGTVVDALGEMEILACCVVTGVEFVATKDGKRGRGNGRVEMRLGDAEGGAVRVWVPRLNIGRAEICLLDGGEGTASADGTRIMFNPASADATVEVEGGE